MDDRQDDDEFVNIEDTGFREESKKYMTPAKALWVYRDNQGLTLAELAELTGIAKSHLSAMEHGKRAIGVTTAKKSGDEMKPSSAIIISSCESENLRKIPIKTRAAFHYNPFLWLDLTITDNGFWSLLRIPLLIKKSSIH